MKFEWVWCRHCDRPTVICPDCGNNCCNGGYGKNGECTTCHKAYKVQDEAIAKGNEPAREGLREIGKTMEEIMEGINNLPTISPE